MPANQPQKKNKGPKTPRDWEMDFCTNIQMVMEQYKPHLTVACMYGHLVFFAQEFKNKMLAINHLKMITARQDVVSAKVEEVNKEIGLARVEMADFQKRTIEKIDELLSPSPVPDAEEEKKEDSDD